VFGFKNLCGQGKHASLEEPPEKGVYLPTPNGKQAAFEAFQ